MGKHLILIPYALVFSSFLFIGFWTGNRISPVIIRSQKVLTAASKNVPLYQTSSSTPNYPIPKQTQVENDDLSLFTQINYLFIYIDNFDSKHPKLLSMWLLISVDGNARWIIFPIIDYDNNQNVNTPLIENLEITHDHRLSERFIRSVDEHKILWHHYILIDETALSKIYSILGYSLDQVTPSNPFRNLCQGLNIRPLALSSLKEISAKHIISDSDLNRTFDEWQLHILENGGLICEFPSQ